MPNRAIVFAGILVTRKPASANGLAAPVAVPNIIKPAADAALGAGA